jgi:two-component system C4-dicarboxylate transport response regulator DctD
MKPQPSILLVDDEPEIRTSYSQALDLAGFAVRSFPTAESVLDLLGHEFDGVLIADIRLPRMDGMTLLGRVRAIDPEIPVVLVTGHADLPFAVRAMREGAYDFLEKPAGAQLLATVARRATDFRRLVVENRRLRSAVGPTDSIESRLTGRSSRIEEIRYQIMAVARTDTDVLIVGETGTGKGVAARAVHEFSDRAARPFVIVDCAGLPSERVESELFGHAVGAFPGATRPRYGKFEHARSGTVLLDEISSASLDLQAKLLRVIEDRAMTPLGSDEKVPLDVRFVATSKVPLEREVAAGRFRADLLYRLNGLTLRLPTLAERREDIPALFMQFVEEAAIRYGRHDVRVTQSTISDITHRDWPGNVRELRNAASRYLLGLGQDHDLVAGDSSTRLADRVADFERSIIAGALLASNGSLKTVYETLGVSRKTLYEKMQKYGLDRHEFAIESGPKPPNEEN